jgi:hypothetical protein
MKIFKKLISLVLIFSLGQVQIQAGSDVWGLGMSHGESSDGEGITNSYLVSNLGLGCETLADKGGSTWKEISNSGDGLSTWKKAMEKLGKANVENGTPQQQVIKIASAPLVPSNGPAPAVAPIPEITPAEMTNSLPSSFNKSVTGGSIEVVVPDLSSGELELVSNFEKDTASELDHKIKKVAKDHADRIRGIVQRIVYCEALRSMTTYHEFEKENIKVDKYKATSGGMMTCMNQANPQQCLLQAAQSGAGELSCQGEGAETQDFPACRRILKTVDGFFYAKQATNSIQGLQQAHEGSKVQRDLAESAQENGSIAVEDSLDGQRKLIKNQAKLARQRALIDGAEMAVLMGMLNKFPDESDMISRCRENQASLSKIKVIAQGTGWKYKYPLTITFKKKGAKNSPVSEYTHTVTVKDLDLSDVVADKEEVCRSVMKESGEYLAMNGDVINTIKGIIAQSGTDALVNLAKGELLDKQAGQIEDAIDDIKKFEPPEFAPLPDQQSLISECLADSTLAGCNQQGSFQDHGFATGGINITGFGEGNTSSGRLNDGLETGAELNDSGDGGSDFNVLPSGGLIPKKPGIASNKQGPRRGAGKFQKKAAGAGAGAGGGGGGGSSAIPGGGGGGGSQGPNGPASAAGRDVKVAFAGSGGRGGFRGGRGLGRGGKSKSKPKNPFSRLLGKNKKRKGTKDLNFRGIASARGGKSLFDQISGQYKSMVKKKRLIKYKFKPSTP